MRAAHYHRLPRARALSSFVVVLAVCVASGRAAGHPFGLSSVNRYLGVEVTRAGVHIAYVLDFAELPAVDELARLDANGDGSVTPAEREAYLAALIPPALAQWTITANGERLSPHPLHQTIEVPAGQGGLSTLRVLLEVEAPAHFAPGSAIDVTVRDDAYHERPGYRDIRADDSADARVLHAREPPRNIEARDRAALRRVDEASFVFMLRAATNRTNATNARRLRLAAPAALALALLGTVAGIIARRARHRSR